MLELRANSISDVGALSFVDVLTEYNSTLTALCLSENDEVTLVFYDAFRPIMNANMNGIRVLHTQEEFDLSSKEIAYHNTMQIGKDLAKNTVLKVLLLQKNFIDDIGAVHIAEALMRNRTLVSLKLDANYIGDGGSSAFAEALKANNVLTNLSLNDSWVGIGPAGAVALAEVLCTNVSLQHLGLRSNQIGDVGAIAFANALKENSTLTSLELDNNNISNEGAAVILMTLKVYNLAIKSLFLENNADVELVLRETIDFVLYPARF
jgi:Ran GTPase-activating protein (RanGAP) involved in mRNA processing and transport